MKKIICILLLFIVMISLIGCDSAEPAIQYIEKEVLVQQCCGSDGIDYAPINELNVAVICKTCNRCLGILPTITKEVPIEVIVEKEVIIEVPVEVIIEKEIIVEVEKVINERCCDGMYMYSFKDNTFIFICMECGFQRVFEKNIIKAE